MSYAAPPEGWFTFGTHVDSTYPLDFSKETDEAGDPLWERPRSEAFTRKSHQASRENDKRGW